MVVAENESVSPGDNDASGCSVSCGTGVKTRAITCVDDRGNVLSKKNCTDPVPRLTKRCHKPICPRWYAGPWGECSKTCGHGTRSRDVRCRRERYHVIRDSRCNSNDKPAVQQSCARNACPDFEWRKKKWSQCTRTCGFGVKYRVVSCVNTTSGVEVLGDLCDRSRRPKHKRRCSEFPCPFMWKAEDWSPCSQSCGEGVSMRRVVCHAVTKEGWVLPGDVPHACRRDEKPHMLSMCNHGECNSRFSWKTGPWGQCTKKCGAGRMKREVICIDRSGKKKKRRHCVSAYRPYKTKPCYLGPCYARSCRDLHRLTGIRQDGEYKLLVRGRFIEVYCHHMKSKSPQEFITLPRGEEHNFSEIYSKRLRNASSCPANGSRLDPCPQCHATPYREAGITRFFRISLDLKSLIVLTRDFTFSSSTNITRVPYASAGDCYSSLPCMQGRFQIDLSGTGFVVSPKTRWMARGHKARKQITVVHGGEVVKGRCGGFCGKCGTFSATGLRLATRT